MQKSYVSCILIWYQVSLLFIFLSPLMIIACKATYIAYNRGLTIRKYNLFCKDHLLSLLGVTMMIGKLWNLWRFDLLKSLCNVWFFFTIISEPTSYVTQCDVVCLQVRHCLVTALEKYLCVEHIGESDYICLLTFKLHLWRQHNEIPAAVWSSLYFNSITYGYNRPVLHFNKYSRT